MNVLRFETVLGSDTVHLPDAEKLIGKNVVITVVEVAPDETPKPRSWKYLGSVSLDGALDQQNIRDLAYD